MDTTVVPHRITLRSGHQVLVRAVRPDDGPGLAEAYDQLSETSRYRRFFTGKPHLFEQSLAYFTDIEPGIYTISNLVGSETEKTSKYNILHLFPQKHS